MAEGVFARLLNLDCAYHSQSMNTVGADYRNLLCGSTLPAHTQMTESAMISSVSDELISGADLRDNGYWVRNLTSPVRFADAVKRMLTATFKDPGPEEKSQPGSIDFLVEIGLSTSLRASVRDISALMGKDKSVTYSSTLVKHSPAIESAMHLAGSLHSKGFPVDL